MTWGLFGGLVGGALGGLAGPLGMGIGAGVGQFLGAALGDNKGVGEALAQGAFTGFSTGILGFGGRYTVQALAPALSAKSSLLPHLGRSVLGTFGTLGSNTAYRDRGESRAMGLPTVGIGRGHEVSTG